MGLGILADREWAGPQSRKQARLAREAVQVLIKEIQKGKERFLIPLDPCIFL